MTKDEEIMEFLHNKVFDPILDSKTVSSKLKSGVNLTIGRMNRLSADKKIQYFWSALATENAVKFSSAMKEEGFLRFEDVSGEFKARFDDAWLSK